MWVSITSDAACAAALQQAVEDYGIVDTATLQAVLHHDASGFARALCTALQAEPPPAAEIGTMTDMAVLNVATQTALTGDVVDTSTAEAMIDEAVCMMDEAEARERACCRGACACLARQRRARVCVTPEGRGPHGLCAYRKAGGRGGDRS